jgi:hypothetical protein
MATTIEIIKELTKQTNSGAKTWISKVDGHNNKVVAEQQPIAPNINTTDGTFFAYVKLDNSNLVLNTFSGKIISAGQERQTATQSGGSPNLILADIGSSTVKVTLAKLDAFQGSLMLQWSGCNINTERSLKEGGFGACVGNPANDNAHKLVASYDFTKTDSNVGKLGQIYSNGNTPWNISTGRGCVLINSPRGTGSLIKTLKFIAYNEGAMDWILEPDTSSIEGKELNNLFNAITKQVAQPFAAFIGL